MSNECFSVWWIYAGCALCAVMGLLFGFMYGVDYTREQAEKTGKSK